VAEAALDKLRVAGVELVEAEVADLETLIGLTTDQVQNHDVRVELPKYLETYHAGVSYDELIARASDDIRQIFTRDIAPGGPNFVSESAYRAAVDVHLAKLRQSYASYFARTGAVATVFPATMVTAPRIGDEQTLQVRGAAVPFDVAVARNIAPGSTAGLPGLVLPAGLASDGLPVALEFDGPSGSDRQLLALGLAVEEVLGRGTPPRPR
jgi:mandelamide amidase